MKIILKEPEFDKDNEREKGRTGKDMYKENIRYRN